MSTLRPNAKRARPRLICLGLSAFDITWNVETLPTGGGKTRALDLREGGGGMAANAAVAAARLGGQVAFWGRAGNDPGGRAMRSELAELGVDVAQFRLFDQGRSSVSGVVVDGAGERMIVNFRGADLPADASWLPLSEVRSADAVLADPRWPEGAETMFSAARAASVPTVLDADVADAAVFDHLLPLTDHAVFSAPALAAYAGDADIAAGLRFAHAQGCRVAGVTLGERGVAWLEDGAIRQLPAFPVEVVDTTGAGDVFHGALAFALGAKLGLAAAFRFSAAVAALKCRQAGGRAGSPDLDTAISFLEQFQE